MSTIQETEGLLQQLPPTDKHWARYYAVQVETIREWVRRYKIPHTLGPKRSIVIDPADWFSHVPREEFAGGSEETP